MGKKKPEKQELDEAALERIADIMLAKMQKANEKPAGPTVAEACASFLALTEGKVARGRIDRRNVRDYRTMGNHFTKAFGPRPLVSLTAEEIETWAAKPNWSGSYQHGVLGYVMTVLRRNGVLLNPPIMRPGSESRGADTCLTDEQFAKVLANVYKPAASGSPGGAGRGDQGDLIPLLKLLRETGARPGEVVGLTVEGVDWVNHCMVLKQHKTRKKTGKPRVLYFNSTAMALLEAQRARYGSGLLFLTRGSRKAYQPNVIVKQLLIVSKRVGFRVIAYGLRHAFATKALSNGVPDALVAELLGHRGTGMLAKHYAHLGQRSHTLRDAAEQATKGPAEK